MSGRKLLTILIFILGAGLLAALLPSCRLYKLEQQLEPANAEFLSQVRYIITAEERKIFLELPDADKDKFKADFWSRRDPDPDTEENEFKDEYLSRIERTNELFRGEGRPGWLTDRGRIYVLFGPPMDRIRNPLGSGETSDRCSEVWYYSNFPVVFNDPYCTGEYRLATYDLSPLQDLNLATMAEPGRARGRAQNPFSREKSLFDFNWGLKNKSITETRVEALVELEIPYAVIWFKSVSGNRLETTLDLQLELKDADKKTIWEHKEAITISLAEEELKDKKSAKYAVEIPLTLDKDLERLAKGKNTLHIWMKNKTGNEELRKVMDF
ncbi:MAG TPA: GWxTD domain-containing protein [Acidobacteriota bacterium]